MSGAIIYIQKDLHITEFQEEILVGCLSVISLLGSLSGGRTSDAIGRKWTMGLGAIIFQTGAAIMTFAPSFTVLMVGRLLAGVGIGFGAMISAVYIAEISPAAARGTLTSLPEICINFGILLGYVSNYAFSGLSEHISWRVMLGVSILPSVFIGVALFVIPESPRWLMMEKRVSEARAVLLQISESEAEVEERLAEIEEAANIMKSMKSEDKAVWRELLNPSPAVRGCYMLAVVFSCSNRSLELMLLSITVQRFSEMLGSSLIRSFLQRQLLLGLLRQFSYWLQFSSLIKLDASRFFMSAPLG